MSGAASYAEVAEGVRATIASYAHALDDGRTEDLVATFCPDGISEVAGMGTYEGEEALRAAFTKWKPVQPQRHLVLNTLVTDWGENEAVAVSDMVFLSKGEAGWSIELVGRYHDTLHRVAGTWRFHRRLVEFVT